MSRSPERKTFSNIVSTFYPESVRYALKYKQGKIGNEEIDSLVFSGKIHEAIYFICKILEDDLNSQKKFIKELTIIFTTNESDVLEKVIVTLKNWLNRLPKEKTVKGNKLAQINRGGIELWQEKFANLAQASIEADSTATPHLLAYAAMLGFAEFINAYKNNPDCQKLVIIVPEWLEDEEKPFIGFKIDLATINVTLYSKEEPLIDNPHFIDDTLKTGKTIDKLHRYWLKKTGEIIDDKSTFVVTNLK